MKKNLDIVTILLYFAILFAFNLLLQIILYYFTEVDTSSLLFGIYLNLILYGILFIIYLLILRPILKLDYIVFKNNLKSILITIGIGFGILLLVSFLVGVIYYIFGIEENASNQEYWELIMASGLFGQISLIIISVLFAPLVEEVTFRYAGFKVLNRLKKFKPWMVILLTSFIFGIMHVNITELEQIVYYMALGCVLGTLYYKTNSIYVPIIVHMIWNLFSSISMFMTL
jgi:membrane protease YdiL (CAAX protease family)